MQPFSLGIVPPRQFGIIGASQATPIVITTGQAHNFVAGDTLTVKGVGGNTAANGTWYARPTGPALVALYSDRYFQSGGASNGAYSGGGVASAPAQLKPAWNDPLPQAQVAKILFLPQAAFGLGALYIGNAGLNQTTLANVLRVINPPPTTGLLDFWELQSADLGNVLNLADYWIDVANTGTEAVVVSYFRR